jgi:2-oxoisovalerate dehydrogenase E2 component (dihydrolipoyl transacylase)
MVSNVDVVGAAESAMSVLVPGGGVGVVALGPVRWVWDVDRGDGKGEGRLKLGISWSADHRVVEGAELAASVETWRGYVERPKRTIAGSSMRMRHFINTKIFYGEKTVLFVGSCDFATTPERFQG